MALYQIYKFLSILLSPLLFLWIKFRVFKGKENPTRYKEKLGLFSKPRPKGKLIWFHAASVGELNSIIFLIKQLHKANPQINFLVTTITLNSEKIFHKAGLPKTIHQFLPHDLPSLVKKFIHHWQPDLGIFVDSELWPNFIIEASRKMKLINLNGRISDKSFEKWKRFPSLITNMYEKFSLILPTSQSELEKINYFIKSNTIKYIGNLKYAIPELPCNNRELTALKKAIAQRKAWIAASTHKGEEEIIISVHKELLKDFPDLLLILAPRHPERGAEIRSLAIENGCTVSLKSKSDKIGNNCNVYIADTIGELGLIYRLSDIVLVGGSLIPHGGHNFLEAAKLGCAIIVGPYTHNFKDLTKEFNDINALLIAKDIDQLTVSVQTLLTKPTLKQKYIKNASSFTAETDQILKETIDAIMSLFK